MIRQGDYWIFENINRIIENANSHFVDSLFINDEEIKDFSHQIEIVPRIKLKNKHWKFKDDQVFINPSNFIIDFYYWIFVDRLRGIGTVRHFKAKKVLLDYSDSKWEYPKVKVWG